MIRQTPGHSRVEAAPGEDDMEVFGPGWRAVPDVTLPARKRHAWAEHLESGNREDYSLPDR